MTPDAFVTLLTSPEVIGLILAAIGFLLATFFQGQIRLFLARAKGRSFWSRYPIAKGDKITVPTATGRAYATVGDEGKDYLEIIPNTDCRNEEFVGFIPWTTIEAIAPSWHKVIYSRAGKPECDEIEGCDMPEYEEDEA
jgi:hypothetical protein